MGQQEEQKGQEKAEQPEEEVGKLEGDAGDSSLAGTSPEEDPPPPPRKVDKEGETFGRISIAMSSFASSGKGKEVSRSDIPVPDAQKK